MRMNMKYRSSYFYKILILFLLTVLATSCVLTVFSYRQLSDSLKSKVWADYQASLRKNAQTWQDLTSEIGQLHQAITLESQTEAFFSMPEFDPVQDYQTYLRVKKMFNINPYLVSVCLYNEAADYALYCGNDSIPLTELWQQMVEENGKLTALEKRCDNGESILVFGYPVYIDSFDHPRGAVFLALDGSLASTHIFGETNCRQVVLDGRGRLLLSGEQNPPFLQSADPLQTGSIAFPNEILSDEDFFNDILTIENRKYLCSALCQKDITFLIYEPEEAVMKPLVRRRNTFLLICLVVMAASACLQFWMVKRLYRPIASIKETFAGSPFADKSVKGEFELIRQVYSKALSQIRALEEKNASYLPRLKAEILRSLLTGSIDCAQAEERLLEHGWDIPFSGMFLTSIRLDRAPENDLQRSMVQTQIRQLLLDELSPLFYVEAVPGYYDDVAGMINTKKEKNATFEHLIRGLASVRDKLLAEYDILLTIGLDGVVHSLQDCRIVYEKVLQLQKNRFALGENQVIYPARVMELLPKPLTWPEPLMKEVLAAFRKGDQKLFSQKASDFIDTISQYEYASASLMFARLSLEIAAGWPPGSGESLPAMDIKMNPATRQEAEAILQKAFTLFQEKKADAEQMKGSRHYKKMLEGQRFIMDHYSDCNLSVDMIAEQLGYSSNYFARVFKSTTGFYVNDYIRQVRIMKAQEFLAATQMTINDISKATGFTTPNYFYSIFKKETGMTPASFREGMEKNI